MLIPLLTSSHEFGSPGLIEAFSGEGEVLEYAVGLLLNLTSFCPPNVALMAKLRGSEILSALKCDEARVAKDQAERVQDMAKTLLHYLHCQ